MLRMVTIDLLYLCRTCKRLGLFKPLPYNWQMISKHWGDWMINPANWGSTKWWMVSDGQCFQLSMENMYLYIYTYVCIKRNQSQSTIFSNLQSIYDWSLNEGNVNPGFISPLVSLIYSAWGFPFCYSLSFFWDEMTKWLSQWINQSGFRYPMLTLQGG